MADRPPQRILVRGVNWLGDAVMTTPALLRLREAWPAAHITLLTRSRLKEIWQTHPAINEVRTFEDGDSVWNIGRSLRNEGFDTALVLPNSPRAALEVWLANIPRRVGYQRPWRDWFLTDAVPPRPGEVRMRKRTVSEIQRLVSAKDTTQTTLPAAAHHIHQYLHLAAVLGANPRPTAPRLAVTDEAVAQFVAKFNLRGGPDAPQYFGLNPGAEYGSAKRWPAARFVAAAVQIQRRTRCRWLIFGLPAEQELGSQIADGIQAKAESKDSGAINLAGATNLGELCAALKFCRVLLTNDSGPMHVAAALGTPVVVPFGSTSPELTGPGLPGEGRHHLLCAPAPCSPCFLRECPIDFRCMLGISVDTVVAAVLRAAG